MARAAVDAEYLSDVWTRINGVFSEQKVSKKGIAKKCGFDRKILSSHINITLTYFARLCEELNISADFFLFGLEKDKEKTNVATDKCYKKELMTLADDFGLLQREDVQGIIESCKSYEEGHQKIMRVYEVAYLK